VRGAAPGHRPLSSSVRAWHPRIRKTSSLHLPSNHGMLSRSVRRKSWRRFSATPAVAVAGTPALRAVAHELGFVHPAAEVDAQAGDRAADAADLDARPAAGAEGLEASDAEYAAAAARLDGTEIQLSGTSSCRDSAPTSHFRSTWNTPAGRAIRPTVCVQKSSKSRGRFRKLATRSGSRLFVCPRSARCHPIAQTAAL
jgi:hypothetical protein